MRTTFFLLLLFAATSCCSESALLDIAPKRALADESVAIAVKGLASHQQILLKAESIDRQGLTWVSEALFEADEIGQIDLKNSPALQGSYQGIDPMGLFWSMRAKEQPYAIFRSPYEGFSVTFSVYADDRKLVSRTIQRVTQDKVVTRTLLRSEEIVGTLFLPQSDKPLPTIITLSGSEGGVGETRAKLLASHGYAVLALAYFNSPGLPDKLAAIPFEYFERAFGWIDAHPALNSSKVGIYGISRGGELALLLATHFPDKIVALVATVPSSIVFPALTKEEMPAWTYKGEAVHPYACVKLSSNNDPLSSVSQEELERATIPVEKIEAPILLISGGDDQMWPSAQVARLIEERLKNRKPSAICHHLCYPDAGHLINVPNLPSMGTRYYHPVLKRSFEMGGTPQANDLASRDSWAHILAFFQKALINDDFQIVPDFGSDCTKPHNHIVND